MKAGIYLGKETIQVTELPMPDIGPDDVLLETLCSSISREDIIAYTQGTSAISSGSPFGHETIAYVVGFGDNVYDFNLGERVYPMSRTSCEDPAQACMLGAFSEYMLLHDARRNVSLFPIPDEIPDSLAAMLEPFARGCHAARCGMKRRSAEELYYILKEDAPCDGDIRYIAGEKAIVFGSDAYAISAAIMLRWFGMDQVTLCSDSSARLAGVEKFGLTAASLLSVDLTAFDCWIDTTGSAEVATCYAKSGKANSRLVLCPATAVPMEEAEAASVMLLDPIALSAQGKSLIGSGDFTLEDLSDSISLMQSGYFDLESIISHSFSPEELEKALQTAADETTGQVLIRF